MQMLHSHFCYLLFVSLQVQTQLVKVQVTVCCVCCYLSITAVWRGHTGDRGQLLSVYMMLHCVSAGTKETATCYTSSHILRWWMMTSNFHCIIIIIIIIKYTDMVALGSYCSFLWRKSKMLLITQCDIQYRCKVLMENKHKADKLQHKRHKSLQYLCSGAVRLSLYFTQSTSSKK